MRIAEVRHPRGYLVAAPRPRTRSNASSNADVPDQTAADHLERVGVVAALRRPGQAAIEVSGPSLLNGLGC